jgi:Pyridoxal-phosphate dependent enzyme
MKVALIYGYTDAAVAQVLGGALSDDSSLAVSRHRLQSLRATEGLDAIITHHDAAVQLVSVKLLTSLECMRQITNIIKHDRVRTRFRNVTVPVVVTKPDDAIDLSDVPGQLALVDYWTTQAKQLEDALASADSADETHDNVRAALVDTRDTAAHIMRYMRTVTESIFATTYEDEDSVAQVVTHLHQIGELTESDASDSVTGAARVLRMLRPAGRVDDITREALTQQRPRSLDDDRLFKLRDGISVASESDPERPEFPPFSPRFPATPTERIYVPQLDREIFIKDESRNFTGSHKDRMAWEIVVHYKEVIQDRLAPSSTSRTVPYASIISNGSAALAIQVMLRCHGLPNLKVLMDQGTRPTVVRKLQRAGCEVYIHDLSERELESSDVLELTENDDGLDFTSRDLVDPNRRRYYDWLAYEILNCGVRHVFIPVGTGDLFVNVLRVLQDELTGVTNDRRLDGGSETIEGLELYGATSKDRKTKMDKLYAAHRPTLEEAKSLVEDMVEAGLCGERSAIYEVAETVRHNVVKKALEVAAANRIMCDASGIAGLALLLQLNERMEFLPGDEILAVNTGWLALP